jgi:3-hydroxyacyl-CoA dehydrogenase
MAIKTFQDTMIRVRYSSIPVVVAPRNDFWWLVVMKFADKVVAAAGNLYGFSGIWRWSYTRWWVALKEMALRASDLFHKMTM